MTDKKTSIDEQFREFVTARSGVLHRAAYLMTGNWATAEDLVQTALTKTYLAWRRIGEIDSVEAYARRVLYTTNASWWRRRSSHERPLDVIPEPRDGHHDHTEQSDRRQVLWRYVLQLPRRQRAVLVLRYYEDYSEADIAAVLGVSTGTVKSQSSRAMRGLRRRMAADGIGSAADVYSPTDGNPA